MGDPEASYRDEYGCSYDSVNDAPQLFSAYAILYDLFNLNTLRVKSLDIILIGIQHADICVILYSRFRPILRNET
jgi:hypothetical protein